MNLKKIRITLAAVVMTLITLLFLDFTGTLHHFLGWLAKIQFLPAVLVLNVVVVIALVALTLVFGRIYCSVLCPLGIFQDLMASLRRKKNRYSYSPELRRLRYGMLVLFVIAMTAGVGAFVALLAPYSSYGRMVQNLLQPVWIAGNNLLAGVAEHYDSYAFYRVDVWIRSLPTFIIAATSFLFVSVLALRGGRTYCNTICPVGTVLSFFARFSWLKICFDEQHCRKCGKCSRNCKASCIDYKTMTVDYSRCVVCGNCLEQCAFDSLHYKHPKSASPLQKSEDDPSSATPAAPADPSRRHFLLGIAMASTAVVVAQKEKKVDGGLAAIEDKAEPHRRQPVTPPGSCSAKNMQQRCTACQLCVSECPNGVLVPSTALLTLMQPAMSYVRGYCRPECHRCSEVCPTGAIKPITLAEKSSTQIGHAVLVRPNCVPLTDGVECGNCARHCPVGAITMVPSDPDDDLSPSVPTVDETRCIGCGACEHLCPARPFPAIYVEGHEVHREI